MSTHNQELRKKILDDILIHEEDCDASLYDEECNCVQQNVATNILKAFSDYEAEIKWVRPQIDLNDPKNMLQFVEDPIEKFNLFIKKWCPDYSHLIDTDDNDGQEIRNMLNQLKRRSE